MMHRSHHTQFHLLAALVVLATLMAPLLDAFSPPSQLVIATTTSHLKSSQSDLSSNVKELELLRRERNTQRGQHNEREQTEEEQDAIIPTTHQETQQQQSDNQKNSIKTILSTPVGDLTQRDLIGLCNSIRYVPVEKSSWSLRILERVLTEVERWEDAQRFDTRTFVKKIHIFSVLTALTKSSQSHKSQRRRYSGGKRGKRQGNQQKQQHLDSKDVDRLKNVVFLLKGLCRDKRTPYCNSDCYQKDVLSFATMIAAESSMTEESAVDVALTFIDEMEKEIDVWDPRIIGSVLNALAHWGRAEEAHVLLSRAMGFKIPTESSDSSSESLKSGNIKCLDRTEASPCYDSLLRAYAKYASLRRRRPHKKKIKQYLSKKKALTRARYILLEHMPEVGVQITNHTCNAVLSGYSALEMGTEAEKLLQEIETLLSLSSSQPSALDTACYNSVLHGYCRESNGVSSAERLFMAMKEQMSLHEGTSNTKVLPPKPDMITYASMLNCYSINRMGAEAYSLVQQIERPTSACYLSAIKALERSNDATSPDKVLSLIDQIEQNRSGGGKGPTTVLNRSLFNVAMQCMIKRGEGAKAEEVLDKYLNSNSSREQKNDVQPYILALNAYENTKPVLKRKEAAESAETLLQKMQSLEKVQKLDAGAYNILLNCFARAGMSSAAEMLLEEFAPTPESYGLVIKAISLSDEKDGVERAWNILYQLGYPRKNVKDVEPFHVPIFTFNSMLKLFARRGMATEAEALLHSIDEFILEGKLKESGPNIRSYEAVLEALGKSNDPDAVERAEALVTRLEVMSELGGGQQPSLKLYNTLLACYANAGKVGSAERLLSRLHEQSLKPDAFSYGATIKALKNSGKSKEIAIARAKELSQSLEKNGGVGNEIIFAHRLSILAKFGLAQQAENLLKEMEEKHTLGDLKQGPGIIHYTAVLNAWSKTDDKKAVARAESLFERMKDDPNLDLDLAAYHGLLLNYAVRGMSKKARCLLQVILDSNNMPPNRNTFTMVIDSYTRASSNTNAGLKAEELLDQMRELQAAGNSDVEPDSVCYASVIRAKQASKPSAGTISDLSEFDKVQLMRELQMERWPFQ